MTISNALPINTILKGNSYNYCIEKVLGQGSFGITYLAKVKLTGSLGELQSNITVAIKEFFMRDLNGRSGTEVLTGSDSDLYHNYRRDFIREANNLSKLRHPNIVKFLESFESNNTAYFSMEYVEGRNLDDYIQLNNGLSEYDALYGIARLCEALSFMHDNFMLHLDIKPLNIMRREDGELVLIDFGLSKQFNSDGNPESSTRIGAGTMGYAPLEQSSYKKQDGFAPTLDIYALGATLFKTLTGITPPDASTVFNDGFPDDVMRDKGISEDIIKLTSWAMEPIKRKRPQTMAEFLKEINRILPFANKKKFTNATQNYLQENTFLDDSENQEVCDIFTVSWSKDVTEYQKTKIRELIRELKYLCNKKVLIDDGHGPEYIDLPLYTLGEDSWKYVYPLMIGENTDGFFPRKTLRNAIEIIHQLEVWTKLPFRLVSEKELRYVNTMPKFKEILRPLWYSPEHGLQYISPCDGRSNDIDIFYMWDEEFDIQIVCDGIHPVYEGNFFDTTCTQDQDEIRPIGFSLYAVRRGKCWNITSPETSLASYLPNDFDTISDIAIWSIPGPGPRPYLFLGIVAVKGNTTSYFSFTANRFTLIKTLTSEEIRERELWTR